ncbi:MAG: nucleoside triphosphate pyrophosphohydrolase [Anaerolineales bacterium]|nr:nucleoside triphosphate pyrophosphohydrolase [Anaerolineales bacterium]
MTGEITIIGLGPGRPELITRQAWEVLEGCERIWVRTMQHPALPSLQEELALEIHSFDQLYEQSESFEQVYASIVENILQMAEASDRVVYAVPGDPMVGEATVPALLDEAVQRGISVNLAHGISFIEPSLRLAKKYAPDGLFVCDALDLAEGHHPPFPPDTPALIGQLYSRLTASNVKLTLLNQYPAAHPVSLIHRAGTADETIEAIALEDLDRRAEYSAMTSLLVPALDHLSAFERFQETVAHLRAPEGCPWDREQTHQSLRSHIMEEAYETLHAIDDDDMEALCEELGDLLLQIVLQAQIATEAGAFTMAEVIAGIQEKLIRRHPHVFGDWDVEDVDQVLHNWETLKERERFEDGSDKGLLDGVPVNLPALAQSGEIQDRVVRVGFDWPAIERVLEKVHEELAEVAEAEDEEQVAAEVGDLLFAVVNYARWLGVDAETALRGANQRFRSRFVSIERAARAQGSKLSELSLEQMEDLWQAAKKDQ